MGEYMHKWYLRIVGSTIFRVYEGQKKRPEGRF